MNPIKLSLYLAALVVCIPAFQGCTPAPFFFRSNYQNTNALLHATDSIETRPYLKAHLKNGEVCIFRESWEVDTLRNVIAGEGTRYDVNRAKVSAGNQLLLIDDIAIFETNQKLGKTESGRATALGVITVIDAAVFAICLANPKTCYGSCPTFYMNENDYFHFADAEGFSNAIAPSLEHPDIDALHNPILTDDDFSITMKNEALETHCVNTVKLLAYPRTESERAHQSPQNDFYLCENNFPISQAMGPEGDITALLTHNDRQERFSLADEKNLRSKEEIHLTFDPILEPKDLGLLISFRQTLMTTYFIYSGMGYMGNEVGDIFAKMETDRQISKNLDKGIKKELGNIDLFVWDEQNLSWEYQGGFYETGPIAFNHQILPLTYTGSGAPLRLKLVLNKGLWRIDHLALTHIKEKVEPVEINPKEILNKGTIDPAALTHIQTPDAYLISLPGDEYKFHFTLPEANQDYELFLYAKGYYLEWMRAHWLEDKNLLKLRQMVEKPRKYLRRETARYKRYETTMEQAFWDSRIDTKTFSHYEN